MGESEAGSPLARRTVLVGACVLAALVAGVIALVAWLTGGSESRMVVLPTGAPTVRVTSDPLSAATAERAKIYTAILGKPNFGPERRYVIERECGDISARPNYRCTGRLFDLRMREAVRAAIGPNVEFGPSRPSLLGGFHGAVVGFGPLQLFGGRARLPMEVYYGRDCVSGATYELARRAGGWLVTGTVGPEWGA